MTRTEAKQTYKSLMMAALETEWTADGEGFGATVAGYELDVTRQLDDSGKPTKKWLWMVKLTAQISETPEVYDTGVASSEGGAKRSASRSARKAQKERWAQILQRQAEAAFAEIAAAATKATDDAPAKPKKKAAPAKAAA